jgi:hypothetical protein
MIREVIKGKNEVLNKVMVTLDQASGYGKEVPDTEFWKLDGSRCITARDDT